MRFGQGLRWHSAVRAAEENEKPGSGTRRREVGGAKIECAVRNLSGAGAALNFISSLGILHENSIS